MKTLTHLTLLLTLAINVTYAQLPVKPSASVLNAERKAALIQFRTASNLLPKEHFRDFVYADFTKLLQAGGSVGKPLDFATVDLSKPKAAVSYSFGGKKSFFANLGASGGYEDGVISLIENQKPAKSYSANASISFIISIDYNYSAEEKLRVKGDLDKELGKIFVYDYERQTEVYYQQQLKASKKVIDTKLDQLAATLKADKDADVTTKRKAISDEMDNYTVIRYKLEKLQKSIVKREENERLFYQKATYATKHLWWITFGQKAGGTQFRFYDALSPEKTVANKKSRSIYHTTASLNYFYKNENRNLRLLLSGSLSAGNFNNFDELTGSEFKTVAKKEIPPDTYTKSDVYTVYDPSAFKSYHATRLFVEGYLLFGERGKFGLRGKYLFENPFGENKTTTQYRRPQQDAEIGFIINTVSKASLKEEKTSPISFEIFYTFNDLYGNQPNVTSKFYKRSEIGIKTAIPFSF